MKKQSGFCRRIAALTLVLCILAALTADIFAANIVASGYCGGEGRGTNLTWTLNSDGALTISGKGRMADYAEDGSNVAPWWSTTAARPVALVLQSGITHIGSYAFSTMMDNSISGVITIPDSVTSIGDHAFSGCYKVSGELILPKNLTYIGREAFSSCTFSGNLTIPSGVRTISAGAFSYCWKMDGHLLVPEGVTKIEERAFFESAISTASIAGSVKEIGENAFNSTNLRLLFLSEGLETIKAGAFANVNLEKIIIPKSVLKIEEGAFNGAHVLGTIQVTEGNSYYTTDYTRAALLDVEESLLLQYACGRADSGYSIPNSVTRIADGAFYKAKHLRNIRLPENLTSIGASAFEDAASLNAVRLPEKLKELGDFAFRRCTALKSINIPKGITEIPFFCFYMCSALEDVDLEEGITNIAWGAFGGCAELSEVTLPASLKKIENRAFANSGLLSITIPGGVDIEDGSIFYQCKNLKSVCIENGIKSLKGTFDGCSKLETVKLPRSLKIIGADTFHGCESLKEIDIQEGVTVLSFNAFSDCPALDAVYFYGSAPTVSEKPSSNSETKRPTFYYLESASGWTEPTYEGFPTAVFSMEHEPNSIIRMDFGDISVNYNGLGCAYFMVTDEYGRGAFGQTVSYVVTDSNGNTRPGQAVADINGLVRIQLYSKNTETFKVEFFQTSGELYPVGGIQKVEFIVAPLTFQHTMRGIIGLIGSISATGGGAVNIGPINFELSLAELKGSIGHKGAVTITEDVHDNKRDLTVELAMDPTYAISAGLGATAELKRFLELTPKSWTRGIEGFNSIAYGITLDEIDDFNYAKKLKLAQFLSDVTVLLLPQSVLRELMIAETKALIDCSYKKTSASFVMSEGKSIASVKIGSDEKPVIAGDTVAIGEKSIWSASMTSNHKEGKKIFEKSFESSESNAFAKLELAKQYGSAGAGGTGQNSTKLDVGSILGFNNSSAASLSATKDSQTDELLALSYKVLKGAGANIFWDKQTRDCYQSVTYIGEDAQKIANEHSMTIGALADGNPLTVSVPHAAYIMNTADGIGHGSETTNVKKGFDWELGFGVAFLLGGKVGLQISGEDSYSYETSSNVLYKGTDYIISSNDGTTLENEIEKQANTIGDIFSGVGEMTWTLLKDLIESAFGVLTGKIKLFQATVENEGRSVNQSYVELSTVKDAERTGGKTAAQSFEICVVQNSESDESALDQPLTSVSKSFTVGKPYQLSVYRDADCTQVISDDTFSQNPLRLTLSYDNDLLQSAQASAETALAIFRFDDAAGGYVKESSSVQDFSRMQVTASITHNGEYILAADGQAPEISEFFASDSSAKPVISAKVTDFSGISGIELYIDDALVVSNASYNSFYNAKSNMFSYTILDALSAGTHSAIMKATDTQGNSSVSKITFETTTLSDGKLTLDIPDSTIESDLFQINAVCLYEGIERILLKLEQITEDGQQTSVLYFPMQQKDGIWTATILGLCGKKDYNAVAVAYDKNGNSAESEKKVLKIDIPEPESGLLITVQQIESVNSNLNVQIGLRNYTSNSQTAAIVIAAYDKAGKMLACATRGAAISKKDASVLRIELPVAYTSAHEVRAFLLEVGETMRPLAACSRYVKNEQEN